MSSTEAQLQELRQRIARNQRLFMQGARAGEREQLAREVTGPLLGLGFLAGLIVGSGPKAVYALREPLVRHAVRVISGLAA
jgi:hypothetical protein